MDLAVWLRSLGLEQYQAAFRENAITEKLLPSLTAEDLKDLGVSIVGHRRALLNAIAELRSNTNTELAQSLDQLRRSHLPDRLRFKSKRSEFRYRTPPDFAQQCPVGSRKIST